MRLSVIFASVLLSSSIALQAQLPTRDPGVNDVPQEPIVPKMRSDLEDEVLRGKVRTIKYETVLLRKSGANNWREVTRVDEFTPSGNKYITSWFRDGEISMRNYFGYIDGFRVCRSYGGAGSQVDKLSYEYYDGKIAKKTTTTGNVFILTTTYTYVNGETEVRLYDRNANLTEKLVFRYDSGGNETGIDIFQAGEDLSQIKTRLNFTYNSFDAIGNWTERSMYSLGNDGEKYVPRETVYRTIAYYPQNSARWFEPIHEPNKPAWEILPQEAKPGEVILSKRNELGILSNFAATPFELYGKRYASVEGFWQMMLYPEGPDDERAKEKHVSWKLTREQVAQMTAFEAKQAGTLAEENMKKLGIDWVTFDGKRFPYRSSTPGEHYRLILAAMRAKAAQNPEVKRILLATGDLILKPDHHGEPSPPPEWKYYEIWMQIRSELQKPAR